MVLSLEMVKDKIPCREMFRVLWTVDSAITVWVGDEDCVEVWSLTSMIDTFCFAFFLLVCIVTIFSWHYSSCFSAFLFLMSSSSTSKTSVAPPGIFGGEP